MSTEKSPEAIALRNTAISSIEPDKDNITINFNPGVTLDDATAEYFNYQWEE